MTIIKHKAWCYHHHPSEKASPKDKSISVSVFVQGNRKITTLTDARGIVTMKSEPYNNYQPKAIKTSDGVEQDNSDD